MEDAVFFYTPDGPFGAFSNFARYGVAMDGVWWPTAEHWFQAQKFDDPSYRETIRRAAAPRMAADLGRTRARPLRDDWDIERVGVMRRVLGVKFRTHPGPRELLLSTVDRLLVESAPGDAFWGTGPEGTGENHLGRLLMELRGALRAEANGPGPEGPADRAGPGLRSAQQGAAIRRRLGRP